MGIKQTVGLSTLAVLALVTPGNAQYRVEERPITLVGCVMHEKDYRLHHSRGPGGPLQSGLGRGNDYVLVDAIEVQPGHMFPAGTDLSCARSLGGRPYEMKGNNESALRVVVGQRVELSGIQTKAEVRAPGDEATGGNTAGPQNFDLEIFEVKVGTFRDPQFAPAVAAAPAPTTTITEMEVIEQPAAPEQPVATAGVEPRRELPKTATPLPFAGLLGLLSVAAALGLRLVRRS